MIDSGTRSAAAQESAATPVDALPCAWGGPVGTAWLRCRAEDFVVEEVLGFDPAGEGQHRLLWVEKRHRNSDEVARALARLAGVRPLAVGYAGRKDRHALTRQWFSVDLAGRPEPDWEALPLTGVRVLAVHRHRRKLQRGALRGNRFQLRLRAVAADRSALEARLRRIAEGGFPNYFGEQRFGRQGANLERARRWFEGRYRPRGAGERGMLLSAVRSHLFNRVLAARVADGTWNRLLCGEAPMLDGRQATFRLAWPEAAEQARCRRLEIHPSGPLWGVGPVLVGGALARLEARLCGRPPGWTEGLARARLRPARRPLRVRAAALRWHWDGADLCLRFDLPAGSFATALLRELLHCREGRCVDNGAPRF